MIAIFRAILTELLKPDAYPSDWYRWTGGQAGHAALIGLPLALLAMWAGCPPTATPAAVGAVYFVVWELVIQRGQDWRDSSADAWHVACGAGLIAVPMVAAPASDLGAMLAGTGTLWVLWVATIVVGIARRISKEGT